MAEQFLFSLYGWKADRRIPLVFDRETDDANGWSSVYLKDGIRLLIYPPEEFSVLANHKDYALNLIVHELTHSLQIGLVSGVPRWVNYVFGNLFFPSQLMPGWMLEGVTVYSESAIDGTGRGHSPVWRAWFDSFFRKGNELSLGELSGSNDHWMGGHIPYLYGSFFYDFVARRHGLERMALFFDEMSDNAIPFLAEYEAKKVFGETFWHMYQEFLQKQRERLFDRDATAQAPFEIGERYHDIMVDLSRPDRYVYYGATQGRRAVYEFDGTAATHLMTLPAASTFAAGDDEFLATVPVLVDSDRMRSDLFLFDTKDSAITRITRGESARYPIFLNDARIGCFTVTDGLHRFRIYDRSDALLRSYDLLPFDAAYTPSLDPAGERVLFTGNLRGADKDLFLLSLSDGTVTRLHLPGDQYGGGFASAHQLIFSTEDNGRIVPVLLDLRDDTLSRLYEPVSIALYPKILADRLFFVGFDNDGYFPAWVPLHPAAAVPVAVERTVIAASTLPATDSAALPSLEEAHGWEGAWPTALIPDYNGGLSQQKIGATLFAESDTGRRGYEISFGKAFSDADTYEARLTYRDDDIMPSFYGQAYYARYRATFGDPDHITYRGAVHDVRTHLSTSSQFNTLWFLTPSFAYRATHSVSASIGFRFRQETVENDLDDPTILPYDPRKSYSVQSGASYNFHFNFSPGSYLLFSPMDQSILRLPASISRDLWTGENLLTLTPSLTYAHLLDEHGKIGAITRHSLYAAFLTDARYSLGGEEKDPELINLDTFIYGASSAVTVRGYRPGALTGRTVYFTNNELRFHILSIEEGLGLFPLMLKNLQGAVFCDIGAGAGDLALRDRSFIASLGVEGKLLTHWWYHVPLMFKFGVARGLTEGGVWNVYVAVGNSF